MEVTPKNLSHELVGGDAWVRSKVNAKVDGLPVKAVAMKGSECATALSCHGL